MPFIYVTTGQMVWLDAEDKDKASKYSYHVLKSTGVVQRGIYSKKFHKTVGRKGLAQDILGLPASRVVLFKNDNKLDCRKKNLLPLPAKKNRNCRARLSRANTSGYHGVSHNKVTKKYEAYIRVNYKLKHLGNFTDPVVAAAAYNKAAIKYFGKDYSRLNIVD